MLTAITKSGKRLCLADAYKKNSLLMLREKEEFFCQTCQEKLVMKLGEKRIFHFAHNKGSACPEHHERESDYHLEGKRQLYQWLQYLGLRPVLEQYDSVIRQRPDIVFTWKNTRYALEFQCSSIPAKLFSSRTNAYLENQYIPLWILGGNQFQRKSVNTVALSAFHYFFLRKTPQDDWTLPYFCPDKKMFILLNNLNPYSPRNALTDFTFQPLAKMQLSHLFNPEKKNNLKIEDWMKKLQQFRAGLGIYDPFHKNKFLKTIYESGLNPHLLPPEIGLPTLHAPFIESSPLVWQTYIYLDLLHMRNPGDSFSIAEANKAFLRRRAKKEITLRELPQITANSYSIAILEYLDLLVKIGILSKIGKWKFQLERKLKIPLSFMEQQESESVFYHKNQLMW
jgi:competence protein CoiA